jgi:hypothetical protein
MSETLYGRRRGPVALPAPPPPRDRDSKLEKYRPLVLCPQNWEMLRDDHPPLGGWLDVGRA